MRKALKAVGIIIAIAFTAYIILLVSASEMTVEGKVLFGVFFAFLGMAMVVGVIVEFDGGDDMPGGDCLSR